MEKFDVEIVTPENLFYSSSVQMAVVPGKRGDFGILEKHSPMISTLKPGLVKITESEDVTREFYVYSGFAEITGTRCTILADDALDIEHYSIAEASNRYQEAQDKFDDPDYGDDADELAKELDFAKNLVEILNR